MPSGPILTRELMTASRRPQTYRQRCALAALMLLVMSGAFATSHLWKPRLLSLHELTTSGSPPATPSCYFNSF